MSMQGRLRLGFCPPRAWGLYHLTLMGSVCVCSVFQLMRNLLGTHLGHSAIYNMCRIMEDR